MATLTKDMLINGIKDVKPLEELGKRLAEADKVQDRNNPNKWITKKAMSTSQIRKFFGAIKRIQADFDNLKGEIILLEPKLAYAVGKDKKESKIDEFYKELSPLIKEIKEDEKKFKNFVSIVEAIVAYHKVYGGE
ncbi:MAG TPA: type III-A CRISPR-associated protein Csm2 [Bacteroidales bacterium]|nr:type III-A CRISPR-associated protein Csm2 [Bacteroidales bacterium]